MIVINMCIYKKFEKVKNKNKTKKYYFKNNKLKN